MKRTLLISGQRANFTTLALDVEKGELSIAAEYPGPFNVSWVEPSSSHGGVDRLVGVSEGTESGLLYTFEIDHERTTCNITSQKPTLGAPAHFVTLQDRSAVALSTYCGCSIALYPMSVTEQAGLLLKDDPRTERLFDFPYKSVEHGPNEQRQRQCHPHQVLEDKRGLLYVPDLGSDRVWILHREQMKLEARGWLQCPPGTGARHAVFTPDGTSLPNSSYVCPLTKPWKLTRTVEEIMYVLGELSHTVIAFDLSTSPAENIQPIDGFAPTVIPPSAHPDYHLTMDSAEICLHPHIPNVLYVSNRWERHLAQLELRLGNKSTKLPPGDAIAIVLLSADGRRVEETKFVRTNLSTIRGMRLSSDGSLVALVGQEGGGIEIYDTSGERGDVWTLVASLNEGLESGIKHVVWL